MPASTKSLKKSNELSLKRKMEVIQYLQKVNSSERKASEIFNVSKTNVNNIKKKYLMMFPKKRFILSKRNLNILRKALKIKTYLMVMNVAYFLKLCQKH